MERRIEADGSGDQGRFHREPNQVRDAGAGVRQAVGGPEVPPGVGHGERGGQASPAWYRVEMVLLTWDQLTGMRC